MNFGNIWDTISGAAKNVGQTIASGASSAWNALTQPITSPSTPIQAGVANVAKTAGGLANDVLSLFGPKTTTVLPANQPIGYDVSGNPTALSPSQLSSGASAFGMTDSKGNFVQNSSTAPSGITSKNIPNSYNPNSGSSTVPTAPSGSSGNGYNPPATSVGGYSFVPSTPAPTGYGYGPKGTTYVLPTAQSGSSGSGSSIPGGGAGNVSAPQGQSGSAGGGISASLGAGSAIQGGSVTGTVADSSNQKNKNNTQQIKAPQFIPYSGFNGASDISNLGLTKTTTPQGGTGYQDSQGNFYTQDASGFHLQTSLPGGAAPTLQQNGQNYSLQPAPGIQTQLGQGRVYTMTDNQGNVSYFVQTPQGFAPVVNSNLNGQTSGQLQGQLGAVNPAIQVSAASQGNVPVGNQANGSQPQGVTVGNTNAPAFNAGGVQNPLDVGALASPGSGTVGDVAQQVASGAVAPQTIDQFNASLQNQINGIVSAMTSGSGIDPSINYNIDPSLIANGDQNILNNIQSDPAGFNAINAQFGVPQLQKQYLQSLSTIGGISSAVSQLTQEILTDPNMPKGLAQNQIQYLGNQANLILTPYTAQSNTIKAQLSYATQNMRTYYSNYWKGQTMNMNQLKLALANNAITPANASQWAAATGMDAGSIATMANFKSALNLATLNNKEAVAQSNEQLTQLASDPTSVQNILSGIQNGLLDPSVINSIPSRGGGAVLKLRVLQGAADAGVNLAGAGISYGFASATNVKQQVAALQNVQGLIPEMLKLSQNAPRSIGAINKYLLPAGTEVGNVAYANFSEAVTAMADELSGALGFGSATDMSREMGYNLTDPNQTPQQFASAMQTIVKPFIDQKAAALYSQMGQYAQTAGGVSTLTPAQSAGSSAASGGNATDPLNLGL